MKNLFNVSMGFLFLISCSESESIQVEQIQITVDKDFAVVNMDSIRIQAEILGPSPEEIERLEIEYLVNGSPLAEAIFIPQESGNFELSARYESVESNRVSVEVFELEKDIESLTLNYEGYSLLTTQPWSITGTFSAEGKIGSRTFPIDWQALTFYANDEPLPTPQGHHFPEAGTYEIHAEIGEVRSNSSKLEVRPSQTYPLRVLPIVFHSYGVDPSLQDLDKLIDTLNNSFNPEGFTRESVSSGLVNPNAVNFSLRFERAQDAPTGVRPTAPGLQVIPSTDGTFPSLTPARFQALEDEYGWDPDIYINVWLADDYGFDFPPFDEVSQSSGSARGLSYSPILEKGMLDGLPSLEFPNTRNPIGDPEEFSQSILLRAGSVLFEHPDFIVNRMGYFLGLFETFEFSCGRYGDYCMDTFLPELNQVSAPIDKVPSCEGPEFRMNNHMAINRKYTCFTYDQRERVRYVLENALYRP